MNASYWKAELQLTFCQRNNKTILTNRRHQGPLLVQRPFYPEDGTCHVYLLHPPAGIVGGDQLTLKAELESGSHALITTPGATKFYASRQQPAVVKQYFDLARNSILEFIPQDTIFFNGAYARIENHFKLHTDSRLFAWETLCFGRTMAQERFLQGEIFSRYQIEIERQDGLLEVLRIQGGDLQKLANCPLTSTVILYPADESMLRQTREVLANYLQLNGATLIEQLLVIRLLGDDNEILQHTLHQLWFTLRPQLTDTPAIAPRIWAT